MPTPDQPNGEPPYIPREMEILSAIQDASMRTTLPIIIAIFKHLSNYTGFVDKNEIKRKIIEDEDLKKSLEHTQITVEDVGLDNSIKVLILQGLFLESSDDKIRLTERGKEAAELLGLIASG